LASGTISKVADNDEQQLRDTAEALQTSSDFIRRDGTPHDFERVIGKRPLQILRLVRGDTGNRCRYFEDGAPRLLAGDCCRAA
jgi:hypothetical protein